MKSVVSIFLMAFALAPQAFPLPDQPLHHYRCKQCLDLSHETLSASWLIEDKILTPTQNKPVLSKRFYRKIRGSELKKGIALGLLADGAVIRLSPASQVHSPANWQQQLQIHTKDSHQSLAQATTVLSSEQEVKQQFVVGPAVIFQLKPGMASEAVKLAYTDKKLPDDSLWLLSVYDKYSDLYLSLEVNKRQYRIGDNLRIRMKVNDDVFLPEINWIQASVIGPVGENLSIDLVQDSYTEYHGSVSLTQDEVAQGENWSVLAVVDMKVNGTDTLRTVQGAFSYVVPSAKVRNIYRPQKDKPLALKARVEAIQASRYQLQAVIYATGNDGDLHSVALAQTSFWLDPGVKEVPLTIDASLPEDMHPPYYLGQIELVDDAQLKPVYRYNDKIPLTELDV